MLRLSIAVLSMLVVSCASSMVNLQNKAIDATSTAKLIVIRPEMKLGAMVAIPIILNDELVAKMSTNSYFEISCKPEQYEIQAGEGDPVSTLLLPMKISFKLVEGKNGYIILRDGMVDKDGTSYLAMTPTQVSAEQGKQELLKANKIK